MKLPKQLCICYILIPPVIFALSSKPSIFTYLRYRIYLFKIFTDQFLGIYKRIGKTTCTDIEQLNSNTRSDKLKSKKKVGDTNAIQGYKNSEKQENEVSRLAGNSSPGTSTCTKPEQRLVLQRRKGTSVEV